MTHRHPVLFVSHGAPDVLLNASATVAAHFAYLTTIADWVTRQGLPAEDARRAGFGKLYLSTDHAGLYEKWGFRYLGQGYHPWGAESRIYERTL